MSVSPPSVNEQIFDHGLHFVPLGGSEEFGINFNLYACDGKWMIFDCGMGFADHRYPNIDILLPDPEFAETYKDHMAGMVITHAHEDHIGAVPYLWPRLRCPIYCTRFTAAILRAKFNEFPNCRGAEIIEIGPGATVEIGLFKCSFLHVPHSIPECVSTLIETPHGNILHSGDWNLDPDPVIGSSINADEFRKIGDAGLLAYVGDSTNALVPGRCGSERHVESGLVSLFSECKGRIGITIFASNIGRIRSIAMAAQAAGRSVCLLGRSLHRMTGAARSCGYLRDVPEFVAEGDMAYMAADQIVYIITGSQGEAQAALARIARGEWPNIKFGKGDTVIFSSRTIPGNEAEINTVKNNLSASGVAIIGPGTTPHKIHVSGHACRDEIMDMLGWLRPRVVIPVHGERLMLDAQAALAVSAGIGQAIVPIDGSVIRLAPGVPAVIDHVKTGLLAVEPQRVVKASHKGIAERRKLQYSGAVHVTVALNKKGDLLMDPQLTLIGFVDGGITGEFDVMQDIKMEIEDALSDLKDDGIRDNGRIEEELRIAVRRFLNQIFGFKPKVSIHLLRI